ncbi:unnamed protein product [Zymoseptoria tritici ST99CH_1A5]|uniref:T6SS Phospholipase effector Tle1-like catalytic domain-containing protein n=2 Tax=Zymoseptoria tritici TaxID=1047171 RepID=A0A1X7S253_ZYMT9|nr:unnamed protein product [Zymoseptoria tritici ST99CH_3D7]SMY27396.1 unnamed protein product [Zymoseptoria tritici ST99CH_1A5]
MAPKYSKDHHDDCKVCEDIHASGTLRKRLIVCCDGTGNSSNQGTETNPTNVARLSRAIANVGFTHHGKPIPQIVYYQAGVGTGSLTKFNAAQQAGFGVGLNEKVCEAYNFLVNNYGPEDEISLFGFSRGAYTARTLGSFICDFGLMTPGMMDYFDEIFEEYKKRKTRDFEKEGWFKNRVRKGELGLNWNDYHDKDGNNIKKLPTRMQWIRTWTHQHITLKIVGVFDTVGSVGMSGRVDQPGKDTDWHSTTLHPKIEHAFHAMALDETRGNFPLTKWHITPECSKVDLRQCWFPGYHSDIGGHADAKSDTNSVDEITFAWMVDQISSESLLQFTPATLRYPILNRINNTSMIENGPNCTIPTSPEDANQRLIRWSDGIMGETNTPMYYVSSFIATFRFWYTREPGVWKDANSQLINPEHLRETIHPTVWHRMSTTECKYRPAALPAKEWSREEASPEEKADDYLYVWVKKDPATGEEVLRLPEYRMKNIKKRDFCHHDEHGEEKHYTLWNESLELKLAPTEVAREHAKL